MGTSFVKILDGMTGEEPGFWMRDEMLELWLRLLALHLPEPAPTELTSATHEIRNKWMLASRGYFKGCVPHEMEFACSTPERRQIVRVTIESLMAKLGESKAVLDASTLNLLGNEECRYPDIERRRLQEIGYAFMDLLDGRIRDTASSTEIMPGSKPYHRTDAS